MKSHIVRKNFRLTESEAQALASAASKLGITESDYLRTLITNPAHVFIADNSFLERIYRELKREGVNVNQIAHQVNRCHDATINAAELANTLSAINLAITSLGSTLDQGGYHANH